MTKQIIDINDLEKIDIRIGLIVDAVNIENTDKLLKLTVDFGEDLPRTVVSGLRPSLQVDNLIGTACAFICNLPERKIKGITSQAMILATQKDNVLHLLKCANSAIGGIVI